MLHSTSLILEDVYLGHDDVDSNSNSSRLKPQKQINSGGKVAIQENVARSPANRSQTKISDSKSTIQSEI